MTLPLTWRATSHKWTSHARATSFRPFLHHSSTAKRSMSRDRGKEPKRSIRHSAMTVTFLGTASSVPSKTRNHSSLSVRLGSDLWLFDCGEATQHQLQRSDLKMGSIEKIFITHLHGDHVFGLVPLLCGVLDGTGGTAEGAIDPRKFNDPNVPPLEIYGPTGLRAYIRSILRYTYCTLGGPYVVHELRSHPDPMRENSQLPPHRMERAGRDIMIDKDGFWRDVYQDNVVTVSAAPIRHSSPCLGYVIQESPVPGKMDAEKYVPHIRRTGGSVRLMAELQRGKTVTLSDGTVLVGPQHRPGRKLTILGDTYDPSSIAPLAADSDLLIHEATNAHLPGLDDTTKPEDTYSSVEQRTKSRGHSTPQMAGAFAKSINAKHLILNHFSTRYAGGDPAEDQYGARIMNTIANLAKSKYGKDVTCARDFFSYDLLVANPDDDEK